MEPRRNLRVLPVLPSNAPTLPNSTSCQLFTVDDSEGTLPPQICHNFNNGLECQSCHRLHVCLLCKRQDHGVGECRASILQLSSGNAGANTIATSHLDSNVESSGPKATPYPAEVPPYYGPATLPWDQQNRHSRRSERGREPNFWHVEFNTPRYRAYREKCRQKGSKEEAKWPDRVEEAFQMALRVYRRRGRKKMPLYGKQSGGNEWISDYIYKTTCERRCRKQVSSHIQVLKGFLRENMEWMSLVADIQPEKSRKRQRGGAQPEGATSGWDGEDSDDASKYQNSQAMSRACNGTLLPQAEFLGTNDHPGPTIRSVEFVMALFKDQGPKVALHTFTSIQTDMGSAPKPLEEISEWRTMFPHLAAYHDGGYNQAPIFLFEANLSLISKYPGVKSQLGAELILDFAQGMAYTEWCCLTRFYEHKGHEIDLGEYYERSQLPDSLYNALSCSPGMVSGDLKLKDIPLKSKWWAELLSEVMARAQKVEAKSKESGNPRLIRDEEEGTRRYLREFSIMQELRAVPLVNGAQSQRMAIVLWKFHQTRKGEAATTSWRRIIPPSSLFQLQSPTSKIMLPHMTLNTAIEDTRALPTMYAASAYHDPAPLQSSIFVENTGSLLATQRSEGSSPDTAQSLGYQSVPSSTNSSFPSSVSNSTYYLQSQEHSYHSHDAEYPAFGSLDSQSSANGFFGPAQEIYGSQDGIYHSQGSIDHDVGSPLYEYRAHNPNVPQNEQDCNGGEIQLHYEAPLIAPRATMISQPQLVQDLERFDSRGLPEQYHESLQQEQSDPQRAYPEQFQHNIDLDLLTTHFSAWEDHLRRYPEGEHRLDDEDITENIRLIRDQYINAETRGTFEGDRAVVGQGEVLRELRDCEEQGEVLRELRDCEEPPESQLKYE